MDWNTLFSSRALKVEIDIFLRDHEHLTNCEALMSDKWLDFMLVHTLAKNIVQIGVGTFC